MAPIHRPPAPFINTAEEWSCARWQSHLALWIPQSDYSYPRLVTGDHIHYTYKDHINGGMSWWNKHNLALGSEQGR